MMKFREGKERDWNAGVEQNSDPYGAAVYVFARRWAEIMEADLASGQQVADVAKAASRIADTEGITGNMYGEAARILSKVWEHGEALRVWHNLDVTLDRRRGEAANAVPGVVINPAIVTIAVHD